MAKRGGGEERVGERRNERGRLFTCHSLRLLFNNLVRAPVWPSPRRMTEHNGGMDIFKSGERIHPRVTYPVKF